MTVYIMKTINWKNGKTNFYLVENGRKKAITMKQYYIFLLQTRNYGKNYYKEKRNEKKIKKLAKEALKKLRRKLPLYEDSNIKL